MEIKLTINFLLSVILFFNVNKNSLEIDHQSLAREDLATLSPEALDQDWKLESYFGSIYVINLSHATARLEHVRKQLAQVGGKNFEVFSAIDGRKEVDEAIWRKIREKPEMKGARTAQEIMKYERQLQGEAGCYLSHLSVVETVREKYKQAVKDLEQACLSQDPAQIEAASKAVKKYSSVLILEDDNGFGIVGLDKQSVTMKTVGTIFRKAMSELPTDWDMVYFMSLPLDPSEKATTHLAKLHGAVCLNAFAINHRVYDTLYTQLKKILDPKSQVVDPVDVEYGVVQNITKCYGIIPSIAYQNDGLSSITSVMGTHLRQTQGYQDHQAEQFMNESSLQLLHPFSSKAENDKCFQFLEESCPFSSLKARFQELEKNNLEGVKLERRKVTRLFKEYLERRIVEGKRHSFDANLSVKQLKDRVFEKLNAHHVMMGKRSYILLSTPRSVQELNALYDAALQKNSRVFVSLFNSQNQEECLNHILEQGKVTEIRTPDGWSITEKARKVLYSLQPIEIVETTLEARSQTGEVRVFTHIHYDGWEQDKRMPSRAHCQLLLKRIEELHVDDTPLVIHSHFGIGRNGVVALLLYVREDINKQLLQGIPLDKVAVNIPKAIFDFRKQRNGFVEKDPLIQDVYDLIVDGSQNF